MKAALVVIRTTLKRQMQFIKIKVYLSLNWMQICTKCKMFLLLLRLLGFDQVKQIFSLRPIPAASMPRS